MALTKKINIWCRYASITTVIMTLLLIFPRHVVATGYANNSESQGLAETRFIWKLSGIDGYACPSLDNEPIERLYYGDDVDVLEVLHDQTPTVTLEHTYQPKVDGQHTHLAKWVKVDYLGDIFYVLDTYLIAVEPPLEDEVSAFVFEHYLDGLSPVVSHAHQGKTDEFCERATFLYENGMRYASTDFGPCEQCGHTEAKLYFPDLETREGRSWQYILPICLSVMKKRCLKFYTRKARSQV